MSYTWLTENLNVMKIIDASVIVFYTFSSKTNTGIKKQHQYIIFFPNLMEASKGV